MFVFKSVPSYPIYPRINLNSNFGNRASKPGFFIHGNILIYLYHVPIKRKMKKISGLAVILSVCIFSYLLLLSSGCKKKENPIKYQYGTFSDSVYNLEGINSAYDDKNSTVYSLPGSVPIIFSSNRGSSGGQFDLVTGLITFTFDQTNGNFDLSSTMSTDPFYTAIANKANTAGDDLGPYTSFVSSDGYEYLFVTSAGAGSQLDLFFERYLPKSGNNTPVITGPNPVTVLNSSSDDAYFSFDSNQDSVYFCSTRSGNYDIYVHHRPDTILFRNWLALPAASSDLVDSLNSSAEDKCPFVYRNIMVFSSNRAGGLGGYDLYYSLFKNGKWNAPVNFGPPVNTEHNEYRPIIGTATNYTNRFMIFSSDRPGGKGGYDLYFTGLNL